MAASSQREEKRAAISTETHIPFPARGPKKGKKEGRDNPKQLSVREKRKEAKKAIEI